MKNFSWSFIAFFISTVATLALVAGCAQDDSNSGSFSDSTIPTVLRNTVWVRDCIYNSGETADETVAWNFGTNSSAIASHSLYDSTDDTCTTQKVTTNTNLDIRRFGGDPTNVTQEVDVTISSVTRVVLTSAEVTDYNNTAQCGYSDWELSVEKEITDSSCGYSGDFYTNMKVDTTYIPNLLYDATMVDDAANREALRSWAYIKQ